MVDHLNFSLILISFCGFDHHFIGIRNIFSLQVKYRRQHVSAELCKLCNYQFFINLTYLLSFFWTDLGKPTGMVLKLHVKPIDEGMLLP